MNYARDNIQRLDAYTPGEQPPPEPPETPETPEATGARIPGVKLNTNENPYPPAEAVLQAVAAVGADQLRRYPPPLAASFRQVAADLHGLSSSQVIATNGGDELLRMALTAFCNVGSGGVGETEPTYSLYDVLANIHDTPIARVPLNEDWSIPSDFAATLNDAGCRLAMVVNPHAPSGRLEPLETLEAIAREFRGVLLIDEAYVNFAERDALTLLEPSRGLDNVLILRTLSKGYSLAGLRFGYGLGSPNLIETLDKVRDSYNTDILSQAAATSALQHADHASANNQKVIAERQRLCNALSDLGWSVAPSKSNFLLATPPTDGPTAQVIYESLKQQAIFVRYFNQDRLRDKLRITVGTPTQNNTLLATLE